MYFYIYIAPFKASRPYFYLAFPVGIRRI